MKKLTVCALVIVIMAAFVAPVWAFGRDPAAMAAASGSSYVVVNPDHTQKLGGASVQAWHGLSQAALHSRAVERVDVKDTGGGSGEGEVPSAGGK